ncbi:glycosyltransferase family 2 protein [Aequorivita sp. H23M31]|uniref:Glycosyltransferase family 2 protein n=1 Tax=Aequorivita ciconiae TaxID=2494375 RepID=A0A410G3B3_9FLAO|nr:glycosyltransferase family A protein [Aequorivita sp. H23M31]QAA81731.1 glycosyltransferase family 2 protein [Aequorivita sp. H23M31]
MDFCIIIPVYNEEAYLERALQSFVDQTVIPTKIIVVNDGSTDGTQKIINSFSEKHAFIEGTTSHSTNLHEPGSKVVNAFYTGYKLLDSRFDFIGKFDADIILPPDYFEKVLALISSDEKIGIAGGNLYIQKGNDWGFEAISKKTKVRGPIKLYRWDCFKDIGGLKKSIGWDTVDELLAQYHGWKIKTDTSLHVKHLKPTGEAYSSAARFKQGEAFYKMRYGFWLTFIASGKLASQKRSFRFFLDSLRGYKKAKEENSDFIISDEEGSFVRKLRWNNILRKIGLR